MHRLLRAARRPHAAWAGARPAGAPGPRGVPSPVAPVLLVAVALLTGCGESAPPEGTALTDSAGVVVATARRAAWEEGGGWQIPRRPLVEIGRVEGPAEHLLSDVTGAARLSDGRIVVADRGSGELRFFDGTGRFLDRAGGQGDGPGEFRSLDFLGRLPGDSLVTWDGRQRRIQLYGPRGGFIRSFAVAGPTDLMVPDMAVGLVDGRRLALEVADVRTLEAGIVRWPSEVLATIDLATGAMDTVARFPGPQAQVAATEEGGYRHGTVAFGADNEYAAAAGRLAAISTERWEVSVMDAQGVTRLILRRPVPPRPADESAAAELVASVTELAYPGGSGASAEEVRRLQTMWREMPRAPTVPLLRSVHLDSSGNVWVEPYFHIGGDPVPFQVFDRRGRWLGAVSFPPGLARAAHPRLAPALRIGEDWVLGVWEDELEVQRVRLYPLVKGG